MSDTKLLLTQAVDNLNAQQFEETDSLCQQVLDTEPNNGRAWHLRGVSFAQQGELEAATECFEKAVEHKPEMSSYQYNLGLAYRRQKQDEQAIECYRSAIEINPEFLEARSNLSSVLYELGRNEEAAIELRQCIERFPEHSAAQVHMLASVTGEEVPDRCNDDYVRTVFDHQFAASFDDDLAELNYRGPELMTAAVEALEGPTVDMDVLDAGCGTGLVAGLLRPIATNLVGLDLSPHMLTEAGKHNVYDELVEDELTRYLEAHPSAYDLILCSDTLCYFGQLEDVMAATFSSLRPNGIFIFSVEHRVTDEDQPPQTFELQNHGRYCHDETYVRETITKCGLTVTRLVRETLRTEYSNEVPGLVVTAQRKNDK